MSQNENLPPLLSCPFCGNPEPTVTEHPPHKHFFVKLPDHPGSWTIECLQCPAGMVDSTLDAVTALWNRRPIPPLPEVKP